MKPRLFCPFCGSPDLVVGAWTKVTTTPVAMEVEDWETRSDRFRCRCGSCGVNLEISLDGPAPGVLDAGQTVLDDWEAGR